MEQIHTAGTAASVAARTHRQQLAYDIDALTNHHGRSLTPNELRIILRIAMWLQLHHSFTEAEALRAASVWAGSSHHTIAAAYRHWQEKHELLEPGLLVRGRGNPQHPYHDTSVPLQQILDIDRKSVV